MGSNPTVPIVVLNKEVKKGSRSMLIVNQKKSEVYNIQMMKCLYVSHSGDWFFINMDLLGEENVTLGDFSSYEKANEVLLKFVDEYKNRIPDQNTVFYIPEK